MTTTTQDVKAGYELFDGCDGVDRKMPRMNEENSYERFDGCYGTVIGCCRSGAFLKLDNGEEAFAYKFASLYPGTKVLCTVLRQADKARKMLVSIDSVVDYFWRCA